MALVGEAHIVVRAITTRVKDDIRNGFDGTDQIAQDAGGKVSDSFRKGFDRNSKNGLFSKKFENEAIAASKAFGRIMTASYFLTPAIAGAVAAISSLVSGLFALGAQLASAAPAALALGGSLSALIQGAIVAKVAFSGVGAALKAGLNAQDAAASSARDLSSLYNRIEQARRNLARVIEQAGEAEENATDNVTNAWERYQDSIISTARAVDDLADAQKDAAEQTQQLGFDVEDAALAQERAAGKLEEARTQLQAVADLPVDSAARQDAELAFKEADLNYRRAADRNNDLKQQQEEATAAGSAGADDLISASNAVSDAKDAELQAFRDYEDAIIQAERTRRDSARQILEAEEAVIDAVNALNAAQNEATSGVNAYAKAMEKLSPAAQEFVKYLISLRGTFKDLRAAAGEDLFPKLQIAIQNLIDKLLPRLIPLFKETGGVLGGIAVQFSKTITESKNLSALERVWKTNDKALKNFGGAGSNLYTIMIQLLDAARPLTKQFSKWIETLTGGWKDTLETNKRNGDLERTLKRAGRTAQQLGRIFSNVFKAFYKIGKAAAGPGSGGQMILDSLEGASVKFLEFVKELRSNGELGQFFRDAAENFIALGGFVTKLAEGFLKLGNNKGVKSFFDKVSEPGGAVESIFDALEKVSGSGLGETFGELANSLASIFNALTDSGSFQVFIDIIAKAAEIAAKIINSPLAMWFIGLVAPIFAAYRAFKFLFTVAKVAFKIVAGGIFGIKRTIASMAKTLKDPFKGLRKSSEETKDELKDQQRVEEQKKDGLTKLQKAVKGTVTGFRKLKDSSKDIRTNMGQASTKVKKLDRDLDKVRRSSGRAGGALKKVGKGLAIGGGVAALITGLFMLSGDEIDKLADKVTKFIDKIPGIVESLAAQIPVIIEKLADSLVGIIDTLTAVLPQLLMSVVSLIPKVIGALAEALPKIFTFLAETIPQILAGLLAQIPLLISTLVGLLPVLIDALISLVPALIDAIIVALPVVIDALALAIPDVIEALARAIPKVIFALARAIPKVITALVKAIPQIIMALVDAIPRVIGALIEAVPQIIQALIIAIPEIISALIEAIPQLITAILGIYQKLLGGIGGKLKDIGGKFWEFLSNGVKDAWEKVKNFFVTIWNWYTALPGKVLRIAGKVWNFLKDTLVTAWNNTKSFFEGVWTWFTELPGKIAEKAKGMWDGITTAFKEAINTIIRLWNNFKLELGPYTIDLPFGKTIDIPKITLDTPDIPLLEKGGIVSPNGGGTLAMIAEAGRPERVEPLDPNGLSKRDKAMIDYMSNGGGGMTINVYPSPGMDERELAAAVSRQIRQSMRKGLA